MPNGFDYMALTFRITDIIKLIYPKQEDINSTRELLLQNWPKGTRGNSLGVHLFVNYIIPTRTNYAAFGSICCPSASLQVNLLSTLLFYKNNVNKNIEAENR